MTDSSVGAATEKLGVGSIIGDTFSIFFSKLLQILMLALIPAAIIALLQFMLVSDVAIDAATGEFDVPWLSIGVMIIITLVGSSIVTALIVRLAYDTKTGHEMRLGSYLSSALAVIGPLLLVSILATLGFMVGFALLVIPGIFLLVIWSVVTPAVVIDRAGMGSFNRSSELTKGYRWACLGALVLMIVCIFVISFITNLLGGLLSGLGAPVAIAVEALTSGLTMSFSGIFSALLYARLREIKEGTSVEQLAEIFA